ncbi:MAG: phytase [Actinomycetota bacterium]
MASLHTARRRWATVLFLAILAAGLPLLPIHNAGAVDQPIGNAQATVETTPVTHPGDAADDPAIWRNPIDPSRSIVIGNDKGGSLEVYDLSGAVIQRFDEGFFGNVDVQTGLVTGTGTTDIAVTYRAGIRIYRIDPATRLLSNITDSGTGSISTGGMGGEGICLYRSPVSGSTYVFVNNRNGVIAQMALSDSDADGLVEGTIVRQWDVGTEVEGCVADDELGDLYISEEDVAIWKYGAEPTDPTTSGSRVGVDRTIAAGGHILPDAEGLTIVYQPGGTGYLLASSQAASDTLNSYLVFERQGNNAFIRSFRLDDGVVDGCGRTDGIDALAADLGPAFPNGMFVCQDNNNTLPGNSGYQNFKFVPLERVVGLTSEPPLNQPPNAVMDASCTGLSCTVWADDSFDPDGTLAAYTWDFGDGTAAVGETMVHTYLMAGDYTITLSVTDDDGAIDQAGRFVSVPASAAGIEFVAQVVANRNSTSHSLVVPTSVAPGDGLLLLFATNTTQTIGEPTGVTGWQPLDTLVMPHAITRVWRKVAGAADAGRTLRISLPGGSKGNLVLVAYRGTSSVDPVATFSRTTDVAGRSSHVSPIASVTSPESWVVSYWTHKDSTTTTLIPPAGVVVRANGTQTGSGTVVGLVADSAAPVAAGTYGGLTAWGAATTSNATMWTIVLTRGP